MEFGLDEGQLLLQQTVADFCADRFPLDSIGSREGKPVDRERWQEMADLGMLDFLAGDVSEAPDAASDQIGIFEGALMFEQLGTHLVPGPLLWTVLTAPHVEGAGQGKLMVGGVGRADVAGGSAVVEYATDLDVLVVLEADAITLHRTDTLAPPEALSPLDPLVSVGRFCGLGSGEEIGDAEAARRMRLMGTVLTAALLVGLSAKALEVAREYALGREQFGASIGSFQAVKHLLADMYVRQALAQSATYAAAAMTQSGDGDLLGAAATAKLLATDAAIDNASTAVQILGGMGFTWNMLPNYLLKRAVVAEHSFGRADDQAQLIGAGVVAQSQGRSAP